MSRDCETCKFRSFKPDELSDDCGHHFKMDGDEIFISMTSSPTSYAKDGKVVHLCPKCRAAWQKAWDRRAVHKTTDPEHVDKKCTLYEVEE